MLFVGGLLSTSVVQPGESDANNDPVPDGPGLIGEDPDPEIVDVADFLTTIHIDGSEGSVVASNEADEIVVNGSTEDIGGYLDFGESYLDLFDVSTPPVEIDAGDGNDLIVVESGSAIISTGDGSDTVDASGMAGGMIFAGTGDLVLGSDIENSSGIGVLATGAVFQGGSSGELAIGNGEGTQLFGGGGNDHLVAFGGDILLSGGEGDDVLRGNASDLQFCQCTRITNIDGQSNDSFDTLFGGDGDDRLYLSQGDTGTGGDGADVFNVFASRSPTGAVTVTDFSPSEDTLNIQVWGGDPWDYGDASYDLTGRITQTTDGGTTSVLVDGTITATVEGVTELAIGYPDPDDLGNYPTHYIDYETGERGDASDFDIIVKVLQARSS